MNKGHFKDSQVVKGITIGAVLIVIYLALNNVTGILDSISYLAWTCNAIYNWRSHRICIQCTYESN